MPSGVLYCGEDGLYEQTGNGDVLGPPVAPESLVVYDRRPESPEQALAPEAEPAEELSRTGDPGELARGKRVFLPLRSLIGCSHHLAFVQLDEPLAGYPTVTIRLQEDMHRGDLLLELDSIQQVRLAGVGQRERIREPGRLSFPGVLVLDGGGGCPEERGAPLLDPDRLELLALRVHHDVLRCTPGFANQAALLSHSARFVQAVYREVGLTPPPTGAEQGGGGVGCAVQSGGGALGPATGCVGWLLVLCGLRLRRRRVSPSAPTAHPAKPRHP